MCIRDRFYDLFESIHAGIRDCAIIAVLIQSVTQHLFTPAATQSLQNRGHAIPFPAFLDAAENNSCISGYVHFLVILQAIAAIAAISLCRLSKIPQDVYKRQVYYYTL